MVAATLKRKPETALNDPTDEDDAMAPTPMVLKKTTVKRAKADAPPKKRRTTSQPTPPVQKNTLDRWFGVAKKTPPPASKEEVAEKTVDAKEHNDEDAEAMEVDASPAVRAPAPKRSKPASPSKNKEKSKKLVQRRILLSDQCRVCESAKTETSTRCERKCMDCEMTVHMSCYGLEGDEEVLPEKWRCRPCQATFDLTKEKPVVDDDDDVDEEDSTVRGIPVHECQGKGDRFDGLYTSSDFAATFLFLKRFRRLGLKLGADITVDTLAAALLSPRDHTLLDELHTRLLQNVGATISKNGSWVDNVIRFLKASDYTIGAELVRRLAASGNANDWLETYYDVPVADRVAILKVLCEAQFDENDTLVEKLGHADTSPESLREEILGLDAKKRTYYLLEDPSNYADGSAWLCRCQSVDGSSWETMADDLASLQSFVRALSYSTETADLQLWQEIANGVAKSLERREKKKLQQAQRLSRVPRMLRSTGLDMTSILPEHGRSSGRSLRTRRAVSYRAFESDDEDEEDSDAEEQSDDDDEDDEEEEVDGDEADGDDHQDRKRRRPARIEAKPTRTSRRLRGSQRRDEENNVSDEDDDDEEEEEDGNENEDNAEEKEVDESSDSE